MAFAPEKYLVPGSISLYSSYWRHNVFPSPQGADCCSPDAVSFNGISPSKMYLTDYMLYHASVFRNSPAGLGNQAARHPSFQTHHDQRISDAMASVEIGAASVNRLSKRGS